MPVLIVVVTDMVSCSPGWPQIHYVAQDDLQLLILLPLPPGSVAIAGRCHYTLVLYVVLKWDPGLSACEASVLSTQLKPCAKRQES